MKTICPYSGVISVHKNLFSRTEHTKAVEIPHPIFSFGTSFLLSRAKDLPLLNQLESKLLLLALLNKTNLFTFRVPAKPSHRTVSRYLPLVLKQVSWMDSKQGSSTNLLTFPSFLVEPETEDLITLSGWLVSCLEARRDYQTSSTRGLLRAKLSVREAAVAKLIHSPYVDKNTYANRLANWCLEIIATKDVTKDTLTYWKRLFTMNRDECATTPPVDFEELLDHITTELATDLAMSNIVALECLYRIREQLAHSLQGPLARFGGAGLTDFRATDLDSLNSNLERMGHERSVGPLDLLPPVRTHGLTDIQWIIKLNLYKVTLRKIQERDNFIAEQAKLAKEQTLKDLSI